MRKEIIGIVLAIPLLLGLLPGSGKDQQKKGTKPTSGKDSLSSMVTFKGDVTPVFKTYCLPCHTEDQMNPSELYLDSYEGLMEGGKHGSPVVPGKADSSLLILKLHAPPPFGDRMPLKSKDPLPADSIDILRKWIDQGAKDN
jgi:hypothetical protein